MTSSRSATLLALAERCEKAEARKQRRLLEDAFHAIATEVGGYDFDDCDRFNAMLDAGVCESAALTLLPAGYAWMLMVTENGDCVAECEPITIWDLENAEWD